MVGMVNCAEERLLRVKEMCNQLQHGGPDDEGFYENETHRLVLGNRRLSLLDLSTNGHMPMAYGGRYHLTYNGEIYNYLELKEELVNIGYQFNNHTDTEVILAAFAQWNVLSFRRLKGMFAFALWDDLEGELYLVRDPSGIKPLYYSLTQQGLQFASESRAVKSIGQHQSTASWQVSLLAYGHIPEPITTKPGIHFLPKGCFLKYIPLTGDNFLQSFSHYSYTEQDFAPETINDNLTGTLNDSVKRHMVADAPLGVFLSGGLDSSILALLASRHKKENLITLSLYFNEDQYSEKKYQDILIKKLGCQNYQYLLNKNEFSDSLVDILNSMDMPSCDGINTWFISRIARQQGLKAVLSGLGSDELFGGYPSFGRVGKARAFQDWAGPLTKIGAMSQHRVLRRLPYLQIEGIKGIYLFLRGLFTPVEIARHLDMDEKQVWETLNDFPVYPIVTPLSKKNQASWMESNMYMQNQLLRDADVMSMAHGVEIRLPFLYEDVIRFANRLPSKLKYSGKFPKQILINCFSNSLPVEIYDRPKMGFGFPFQEWLKDTAYVHQLMNNAPAEFKASYNAFIQGKMHWAHFVCLLLLMHNQNSH